MSKSLFWLTVQGRSVVVGRSKWKELEAAGCHHIATRKQRTMNTCAMLSSHSPLILSRIPRRECCHSQWVGLPTLTKATKMISPRQGQRPVLGNSKFCKVDNLNQQTQISVWLFLSNLFILMDIYRIGFTIISNLKSPRNRRATERIRLANEALKSSHSESGFPWAALCWTELAH